MSTTFCYNFYMRIGDKLKELRNIKEVTQFEIASKTGISRSVYSQYENNLVDPSAFVIKKLAEYFEVSSDYLLGLEDDFGTRIPAVPTGAAKAMGDTLTAQERELLELFRELSPYLQGMTMEAVKSWAKKNNNGEQKKA